MQSWKERYRASIRNGRGWVGQISLMLAMAIYLSVSLWAQSDSGRVVGTVLDASGAVVEGATLTLTNSTNGMQLKGQSNGSGQISIPAVPRGNYEARIEAKGFQPQSEIFTINVMQVQSLLFHLQPGAVSSTVTVTDAAPMVDTSDPSIGATIEGTQITELPLNGRNALNLALLTPGVTQGVYGEGSQDTVNRNGESGGGAISVNGVRMQANNFILDGVDNNDGLQNVILFFPPVEATQEFRVATSIAPAEFGRAGGAFVVSSIKSGSNEIHGAVSEFYRSGKFAANPNYRFLGAAASANPSYNRNQWGGALGLPVIKNKFFAFGDYQAFRESLPVNPSYHTVPTAAMREDADFSELFDKANTYNSFITTFPKCYPNAATLNNDLAANSKGQIFDPQSCEPFAGNIIPAARRNTAAMKYFNAYPNATRTDRILQNYLVQQHASNDYNTFDVRLDWNRTANDQWFARFAYDNSVNKLSSVLAPTLPAGSGSGQNYVHARGWVLGSTHTFSNTIVNEARLAYNRDNYGYQPPNYGENVSANLGIVNANRNLQTSGGALIGGWNNEIEYTGDYGLFAVPQNTYEFTDTLNITRNRHSIKAGGTFLRRQVEFFRPIAGKGFFSIAGNGTDFTGYEPTELLVGGMDNYTIGSQNGFFGNISQEDGLYVQDDWRINSRLTVNLGFRWDLLTWPYEEHDRQAAFTVPDGTILEAGKNGISRSIIHQDYTNFAPRIGFAYDVLGNGTLAVRGGYGIFYFPDYGGISNQLGQQPPYGGSVSYQAANGYCITFTGQTATRGSAYTCPGYSSASAVTTALPEPGFTNFDINNPPQGLSGLAVNLDNRHSRTQQWNLQIQKQLGQRDVVTASYVGVRGDRLSTYYSYNTYAFGGKALPLPNLGGISYNNYNGISNYNGLQAHYEHRADGAVMTASYAWSHALDDSAGSYDSATVSLVSNPMANYGNSLNDVRQNLTTSILYEVPFGRGKRFGSKVSLPIDWLIGGWQTSLVAILQGGQPFDLSTGVNNPGNRPDLVKPVHYSKSISGYWFQPSSFSSDIPVETSTDGKLAGVYSRIGTLGRNQLYGPSYRVVNLSAQKNLHLTGNVTLELHGDAFNLLNTAEFTNPGGTMSNTGSFGIITGTRSNSNRQIQLATRLTF